MPTTPMTCPNCGASLQFNSEEETLVCNYCGSTLAIKGEHAKSHIFRAQKTSSEKDFYIRLGVLKAYYGDSFDVVIPDNVVVIENAFTGLRIKNVVIPNGVNEIVRNAFANCSELESIVIPNSVSKIGINAFLGCKSLKSIIIPPKVNEISIGAFKDCSSLSSITLSDSIKTINEDAFSGCSSLESITIPNSVICIAAYAFQNCVSLRTITIPSNDIVIGTHAFKGCTALDSVVGNKHIESFLDGDAFDFTPLQKKEKEIRDNLQRCKEQETLSRMEKNLCIHCGCEFKGVFRKICSNCGKPKDY